LATKKTRAYQQRGLRILKEIVQKLYCGWYDVAVATRVCNH
jgi:hypothetical protein